MRDRAPTSRGATETVLLQERAARERAERALQEALATVRELQTKLGHAELAQWEASETAQAARDAADALRAAHQEQEARWHEDLAAERAARAMAEAALAEVVQDAAVEPARVPAKRVPKETRKAASTPRQREPRPVKWWLKSARWR